jgi:acetolactate synthase-1/2/3 large subunit
VCKASWTADDAAGLGRLIAKALATAQGSRPGPVHLSLPFDLLQAGVKQPARARRARQGKAVAARDVARLARWLGKASRPLLLAGAAFNNASHRALLAALDGAGGVPALALESPRGINDPALGAFAEVLAQADRIVFLGRGPDYCVRFAEQPIVHPQCRFALVDAQHSMLERGQRVLGKRLRHALHADPALLAEALATALRAQPAQGRWAEEVRAALAYQPEAWRDVRSDPARGVHPLPLCAAVQAFIDARPDTVLVSDGGEFGQWAQACVRTACRVTNGPAGAIGAALPFAIAAKLARPQATVVAMLGDGTAGFHLAEFDTALRAGTPFVAVVGNDARWNAEYQIQLREYGRERLVGCELLPTRYDQVAAAFGGFGERVTEAQQVLAAAHRAIDSRLPACLNVMIEGLAAPDMKRP